MSALKCSTEMLAIRGSRTAKYLKLTFSNRALSLRFLMTRFTSLFVVFMVLIA